MDKFKLESNYKPTIDQQRAIDELVDGINLNKKVQVLLGATGTGKTFTIANVINKVNKPTLILAHNKTLAGQLFEEFKKLFPNNRVEYFISNFDFYQPEAYIAASDTYIDKTAKSNMEIELMRISAVASVLSCRDTIVVSSVASIYSLSNPDDFKNLVLDFRINEKYNRKEIISSLVVSQYERNEISLTPGSFSFKGDVLLIYPPISNAEIIRIEFFDDECESISLLDPLTRKVNKKLNIVSLIPAYEHVSSTERIKIACESIKKELDERIKYFKSVNKPLEAERIENRTLHDIDSLNEFGTCPGIENYSLHMDGRKPGQTPYCLFDYFPKDFLLVVDESHVSLPQVRGMYNGDRSRKESLVNYGFRLPTALDNRPLTFEEFESKINQAIYVSATPGDYELEKSNNTYVEQIIRPTGLLDPIVEVRPSLNQIDDIVNEIQRRIEKNERTIITTLTIAMAEELTKYLKNINIKVCYLHSEIKTLERTKILYELRKGKFDVIVGINLLREGLDLPEVSLICILDANKEGFLRSKRSLIQIIGRAARNVNGKVIMYGDTITTSMQEAIDETNRRRQIQSQYNIDNNIIPSTIMKDLKIPSCLLNKEKDDIIDVADKNINKDKLIEELTIEMKQAAKDLDFEHAAYLRDMIIELKGD